MNIFDIEFIQKLKFFGNRLVQLGGLENRTCYKTIAVLFHISIKENASTGFRKAGNTADIADFSSNKSFIR